MSNLYKNDLMMKDLIELKPLWSSLAPSIEGSFQEKSLPKGYAEAAKDVGDQLINIFLILPTIYVVYVHYIDESFVPIAISSTLFWILAVTLLISFGSLLRKIVIVGALLQKSKAPIVHTKKQHQVADDLTTKIARGDSA